MWRRGHQELERTTKANWDCDTEAQKGFTEVHKIRDTKSTEHRVRRMRIEYNQQSIALTRYACRDSRTVKISRAETVNAVE
jgi:hypothetical protein